jgi:hypothetical protein
MRIVGIVAPGAALGGRAAARCERSFLAVIFAAKATIAFALYSIGFAGVSADEYARSILAMEWAHNPYLVVGQTAWLPFELYIDGSLLRLIPDPLWLPRFTIFIASCLVILFFFKLVRLLFDSFFVAATSTVALLVYP